MKRIVISGTYCTGKTTLTQALSLATGIPATHALTMREILPELYPGKTLRECAYAELIHLGMRRFEERIRAESQLSGGFISDGCTLQEWLYGSTRLITGAYPDELPWKLRLKQLWNRRSYGDFKKLLRGFEHMAKAYASTHYDLFFHLPVEFGFVPDGHRPTSESFRTVSEHRLLATYNELGLPVHKISGSMADRLLQLLTQLEIEPIQPIATCIEQAIAITKTRFDSIKLESGQDT